MGAWGPAIFSDDLACDIRDDFKELIGDGLTPQEATESLVDTYADSISDDDEHGVFWLSLAQVQWKTGRLLDHVKQHALEVIESGSDLKRWEYDNKTLKKRTAVLEKLKETLRSEPPPPKRIPKRLRATTPFDVGHYFYYETNSGRYTFFKVVAHHRDKGGVYPICELLQWYSAELPLRFNPFKLNWTLNTRKIKRLKTVKLNGTEQFMLADPTKKYIPPINRFGILIKTKIEQPEASGYRVLLWRNLDNLLEVTFSDQNS